MQFLDMLLHLDKYIGFILENYHNYFYILFFLVIFCETGLVVTPFLPGDSLLFIAGAFAGSGQLHIGLLCVILVIAAFLGDNVNFLVIPIQKFFVKISWTRRINFMNVMVLRLL